MTKDGIMAVTRAFLVALFALSAQPVIAAPLPTLIDFNSDSPGLPPSTGGAKQPSSLFVSDGTTVLVQSSANGIGTRPVVVSAEAPNQFAGLFVDFDPIASGLLHIEAEVAFNRFIDAFFLQTGVAPLGALVTRLDALSNGTIVDDKSRTVIGTYAPNQPFAVSMDIDMSGMTWSAAIDNELNGFFDDPLVSGLPFENAVSVLPYVASLDASLSIFPVVPLGGSVAYENISISTPASPVLAPPTLLLLAIGVAALVGAEWRRKGCN